MNRLAPYRGSFLRLALVSAAVMAVVAAIFHIVERVGSHRAAARAATERRAQDPQPFAPGLLGDADRARVLQAAEITEQTLRLAEAGIQRAIEPDIRRYAAGLVDRQTTARNEIETLAAQHGMVLPTGRGPLQPVDASAAVEGRRFDSGFMASAVDLQWRALQFFDAMAREATDPSLRNFARAVLPRLHEELTRAQRLMDRNGK